MLEFNTANFDAEVINSKEPVLVDFYADWCPPCRKMTPVVDVLSEQVTHAKVGKVDITTDNSLAVKYGVESIPTFLFFKNGKVEQRLLGIQKPEKLKEVLNALA